MLKKVAVTEPRLLLAAKQVKALCQQKLRCHQRCSVEAISYVYASKHTHSLCVYAFI